MLKSLMPSAADNNFEIMHHGQLFVAQCLSDLDQIAAIAHDWKRLEDETEEQFIGFQSFDWCYNWCLENEKLRPNQQKLDIQVHVLRRNGDIVLILPMMIKKTHLGVKRLSFLTEPHAQYGNVICDRSRAPLNICQKLWAHIKNNSAVDAVALNKIPSGSYLTQIIGTDGVVEKSNKHSSMLDLNAFETWDGYLASLDSKSRKKRKRVRNKLAKHGNVSFEVHSGGSDEYKALTALALDFKLEWLAQTGRRDGLLSQKFTRQYLCNLPGTPASSGARPEGAQIFVVKLDGKPIAMEFGLCVNGHYYSYLGSFDWAQRSLSPGRIQIEMAQEWCKSAGLDTFDFLGDPMDYKSDWTNAQHGLESRSIGITPRGFLYSYGWKARFRPALHSFFNNMNASTRARILSGISFLRHGLKAG